MAKLVDDWEQENEGKKGKKHSLVETNKNPNGIVRGRNPSNILGPCIRITHH